MRDFLNIFLALLLPFVIPFVYTNRNPKGTQMEAEIKQKKRKRRKGAPATLTLKGIPGTVHEFMIEYQRAISARPGIRRAFNIKRTYVEYLIEKVEQERQAKSLAL
jgi:uncharacterized membrane protein YqaE (UPF0057 family)